MDIVGKRFTNKLGAEFEVVAQSYSTSKNKYYLITFTQTGYTANITKTMIYKGNIKDPFHPSVCNIGYRGRCELNCKTREYRVWHNMLNRCYNQNSTEYKRYGHKGVTVCERWHSFENFVNDLPYIPGYNHNLFYENAIFLDKDKKVKSSEKIYSPDTCQFLTSKENNPQYNSYAFVAVAPDGDKMFGFNVSDFSKQNKLNPKQVYSVLNNHQNTHKKWRFTKIELQESVETIENML